MCALIALLILGGYLLLGKVSADFPIPVVVRAELPGDLEPGQRVSIDASTIQESGEALSNEFHFDTNSMGFRGLEVNLTPDTYTVMTIGDGYAFGTSVDGNRTLCDELNRRFSADFSKRSFACVNAALPCMCLEDEFQYLDEKGEMTRPQLLVLVLSEDDVWEMARPVVLRDLYKCLRSSRWCAARMLYYRHVKGMFRTRDSLLDRVGRDGLMQLSHDSLWEHRGLMSNLIARVKGWGGRVLILADGSETDAVRGMLAQLGLPILLVADSTDCPVPLAPDGHWAAATHQYASELVVAWIEEFILMKEPSRVPTPPCSGL